MLADCHIHNWFSFIDERLAICRQIGEDNSLFQSTVFSRRRLLLRAANDRRLESF